MFSWPDLLGRRMLLQVSGSSYSVSKIMEYKLKEISPSGNYLLLQNAYGNKEWILAQNVRLIEALHQPEIRPQIDS